MQTVLDPSWCPFGNESRDDGGDCRSENRSSDDCVPIQTRFPDVVDDPALQWTFGCFYSLVWVFGMVGNLTVLYMLLMKRVDFTVRTVFIVSLTVSDLLMGFTSLPVTAIAIFTRVWIFADELCYVIGFLQACSVFVSSFTLITIAVDRYYLIVYPHSVRITYQVAKFVVASFWIFSALLAVPMLVATRVERLETRINVCGTICNERWHNRWMRSAYGLTVFVVQYGLPLLLCSVLYVKISRRIRWQFSARLLAQHTVSPDLLSRSMLRRRRTNRMMAAMVVTFVLSWFPINVINLARDFEIFDSVLSLKYFTLTFALAHLMAMTSLIWNPIIFSFFNQKFRKAIKNFVNGQSVFERTATSVF